MGSINQPASDYWGTPMTGNQQMVSFLGFTGFHTWIPCSPCLFSRIDPVRKNPPGALGLFASSVHQPWDGDRRSAIDTTRTSRTPRPVPWLEHVGNWWSWSEVISMGFLISWIKSLDYSLIFWCFVYPWVRCFGTIQSVASWIIPMTWMTGMTGYAGRPDNGIIVRFTESGFVYVITRKW